jgi:hypothetical protein
VEFSLKEVDLREANGFKNKIRASGARAVDDFVHGYYIFLWLFADGPQRRRVSNKNRRRREKMERYGMVFLLVLLINLLVGGLATEYVVEFWAGYIKGVPTDVPFLPCAVAGVFLGEFTIPAAIATWILSFIL